MELDDLKNSWDEASSLGGEQQNLTPKLINEMTQRKFASKVNRIMYPEIIGIGFCLVGACYVAANFHWLDTVFLKIAGVLSVLLLLTISFLSALSILKINKKPDLKMSYAETLNAFASEKLQFHKLQKVNVTLCYLLFVVAVVLLSKIVKGIDISQNPYYWTFSFTIGYIFLMFYSRWVSRHYRNSLQQAEELLAELA
jgi:hypothetical protein